MADLLEIEPSSETIIVQGLGGQEVNVKGLSLKGIGFLIKSHPKLVEVFKGGGLDLSDLDAVIDLGTEFTADFLAAGLGYVGDEKAREMCKQLPAEDVYNIAEAILKMSFPTGPAAFFQKLQTQMGAVVKLQTAQNESSPLQESEEAPKEGSQKDQDQKPSLKKVNNI